MHRKCVMTHLWKVTVLAATAGLGLILTSRLAAAEQGVKPMVEKLDNGLEMLLVERYEQPIVAGCMAYDVSYDA